MKYCQNPGKESQLNSSVPLAVYSKAVSRHEWLGAASGFVPLQEKGCHLLPDVRDMTLLRFSPAYRKVIARQGSGIFYVAIFDVARETGDVSWSSGARVMTRLIPGIHNS